MGVVAEADLASGASLAGSLIDMQYFVRTMEKHENRSNTFSPEIPCPGLLAAKAEAKRIVMASDPALRLLADACSRNGGQVRTMYRCWINEQGSFRESALL